MTKTAAVLAAATVVAGLLALASRPAPRAAAAPPEGREVSIWFESFCAFGAGEIVRERYLLERGAFTDVDLAARLQEIEAGYQASPAGADSYRIVARAESTEILRVTRLAAACPEDPALFWLHTIVAGEEASYQTIQTFPAPPTGLDVQNAFDLAAAGGADAIGVFVTAPGEHNVAEGSLETEGFEPPAGVGPLF